MENLGFSVSLLAGSPFHRPTQSVSSGRNPFPWNKSGVLLSEGEDGFKVDKTRRCKCIFWSVTAGSFSSI